nr:transposase, MuDR, MULE transposase domain protein [Tanacetum cinerariifolium]
MEEDDRINIMVKLPSFDNSMDITDNEEKALDLAVRLKAIQEGYQFLSQRTDPDRKKKQGSVTRIKTDDKRVFEMLFIALGASIRKFLNYLCPLLIIDAAHLKGEYKGTNLVAVGMDGNNQIMPVAFGICKGETGPCWSWWMSVLKECIGDHSNLLFISDRHHAIALAVHNEFPLAFHAFEHQKLTANVKYEITDWVADKVHKRKLKSATWIVYGANQFTKDDDPIVEVDRGCMLHPLQVYDRTSQEFHNVGISADGVLNINVLAMDFEDMVSYLTRKIPKRFTTLYYTLPSNHTLSGLKAIKNDYDTNVMYDTAKVAGKLQIYAAHHPIDLSMVLIPNDSSLEKSFACIISKETILKQKESFRYLHQMQKQNKRFDYYELLGKLGFINKTKPTKPHTQTIFNFLVHNNGQLVIDDKRDPIYVNGGTMNITILRMKLQEMKQYLFNIVGKNINALYYTVPHNDFSITIKLKNNYDMHVLFDISSARGKLEIYIGHRKERRLHKMITLIDQMIEWAEQEHFKDEETKEFHCRTEIWKNQLQAEVTLANKLSRELTRVAEQMRIHEIYMAMLHAMPLTSLNSYGLHALLMTHESDIRITHNLRTTRDELLRSIAEKQKFIDNYRAI